MPILSRSLLADLGINLSDEDYQSLADHFESTLEERVINEIVLELSPEQAEELSHMQEASDDQIVDWYAPMYQTLQILCLTKSISCSAS